MKTVIALLCLAGSLWAAPPKVPPPVAVAVGDDVMVEVAVEEGKKGAYAPGFDLADCILFRGYSASEQTMSFLVRPKKPGKYIVIFWTVGEAASAQLVVTAGGAAPAPLPQPTPTPAPVPQPTPKPQTDRLAIVVVMDTQQMTPTHASMYAAVRKFADGTGHTVDGFSIQDPATTAKGYARYAKLAGALPAVIVMDGSRDDPHAPLDYFQLGDSPDIVHSRLRALIR